MQPWLYQIVRNATSGALVMFIDLNYGTLHTDPPDIDEADAAMLTIAAGDVNES